MSIECENCFIKAAIDMSQDPRKAREIQITACKACKQIEKIDLSIQASIEELINEVIENSPDSP